jgi:hypothetical protein
MVVVTSHPNNPELLLEIGKYVSYDIQFYVGIGLNICDAVKEFYDKSDTEDIDEESIEENVLAGEFHFLQDANEENLAFTLDNEDNFE